MAKTEKFLCNITAKDRPKVLRLASPPADATWRPFSLSFGDPQNPPSVPDTEWVGVYQKRRRSRKRGS